MLEKNYFSIKSNQNPPKEKRQIFKAFLLTLVCSAAILGIVAFLRWVYPVRISRAAVVTFTGAASSTWQTGSNWSTSAVPTSADSVTIAPASASVVTLWAGQLANFDTLTVGGGTATSTLVLIGNIGTGTNIVVEKNGILELRNATPQTISGSLTVKAGGVLTHTANGGAQSYVVDFTAQSIDVQAGGLIDVSNKGYAGRTGSAGQGPGAGLGGGDSVSSGGGHVGQGGNSMYGTYAGGKGYCDITNVNTIGSSGGGGFGQGGAGGGLVRLYAVGTVTLNGGITAAGAAASGNISTAGGAGGGIKITADTISGSPWVFSVAGGSGGSGTSGAGGGCVQLTYTTSNSITDSQVALTGGGSGGGNGGNPGGPGLMYVKQNSATYGDLYSNSTFNVVNATTSIPFQNFTLNSLSLTRAKIIVTSTQRLTFNNGNGTPFANSSASAPGTLFVQGAVDLGGTGNIGSVIIDMHGGALVNPSSVTIGTGGGLKFFGVSSMTPLTSVSSSGQLYLVRNGFLNSTMSLTMNSGATTTMSGYTSSSQPLVLNNLTINNNSLLTHDANGSSQTNVINIAANNITVNTGGSINVDGKGYAQPAGCYVSGGGPGGGGGNGFTGSYGAGGGGHGGRGASGANGSGSGGAAYCVVSDVGTMGSSGGNGQACSGLGGAGGGLIILSATSTVTINGAISAQGTSMISSSNGAGAGGGIKITAQTVAGTPTSFTAAGGNQSVSYAGAGGGGCVRIGYANSSSITSASITVSGGTSSLSTPGSVGLISVSSTVPSAPTTPYADSFDAVTGSVNPTNLTTTTPVFSAICSTPNGDTCTGAAIEVDDTADFSSPVWQSGQISIAAVSNNARSQSIRFTGTPLKYNTTYYWRIRFYNSYGGGSWSGGTDTLYIPRTLELFSFNNGGAVQSGKTAVVAWGSTGGATTTAETVKIEYSNDNFVSAVATAASSAVSGGGATSTVYTYSWTIPSSIAVCGAASCSGIKMRISTNNDGNNYAVTSEQSFTIQNSSASGILYGRTFNNSYFYSLSDSVYTPFSGGSVSLPAPITWTRRKPITITNGTASNLTDFQVSIPVTYDADMQSNFNDLRFTASDGTTLLNYWIESKVNGSSATVWVQVPSVPASSSATIYMYFGNSTVASASSISNTFLFGDDFSGSLDTTKWTVVGNPVNTAGGIFTASSSNSGIWATNYALTGSAIIETLVQKGSSSYGRVSFVNAASRFKQGMTNGDRGFDYLMYSGSLYGQTADTTGQQETYFGSYGTAYHRVKMVFTSGSSVGWYDTVPGSGTTISTSLGNSGLDYIPEPADDLHPEIYNYSGTMQNDWIFVRQFASADPSVSVGVKQTVSTNLGSPSSDPSITFLSGHSFTNASSFTASTTGPVKFQFSNNNGSSWKYCVGNTPTDATNSSSQASWASEITNACLANLPPGTMSVRSYLVLPTSTPQSSIDYVGVALSNSVNSMPVSTSTTGITTSSITYSWSSGGGDETYYTVEQSTDGYTFTSVATTSLATPSYTFTGLSTNTPYWFRVAGADGRAATSSYATSSRVYTLAATPNRVAGVSALSETSISVQIDTNTLNGNSADTTRFIIKDSGSLTPTYLQSDGTWSTALAILTYAQLGAGTLTTTGLLPNTLHTVSVAALNPDGATTPYSEGLSVYTLANVPGAPSVTNATTSTMDITIATNNNPATTQYAIYNATGGNYLATSGFSNGTTAVWQTRASWGTGFTARGLSSDTAYQFQIYARNGDGVVATVSSLSASLSTNGINNPSLSPVTSEIGTGSIRLDWTAGGGDETYYILEKSRDGILYDVVATVPKGTEYYTFTGLSVNTQYWFRLASGNGVDPDSAYVVATPAFTAAALPGPLTTLSATATTTLSFTIGSATINGNPTGSETTYIVRDSAGVTNQYLQNDGTWGSSPVAFTYAQLGSGAVVQTTGLSPNSQHAISLAAVNGDGMQTSFGETRNIYTLASTPWSVALRINTDNTALLSWLGDATDYQVSGTRNVDWANDLFAIVRNVECDTSLHFQVKGRNADGVETAFSNTVFGVTNPCGGWSVWRPPANANPVAQEQDVTNATSTIDDQLVPKATEITLKSDVSLSVGQSALVAIGAETHTITINNANPESVTITLHSDPITATLKLNVPQDFDTDGDGIPDVRGLYTGIVNGKTQIIFTAIPSIPAGIATSTVPVATPSSTPATTPATGSLVPIVAVPDYMFTSLLKRGSVGPEVIELQKRLKQEGFFPQAIDFAPSFGAITEFSLKTYQQARNLTPTGVLDTATRQTLNGETKTIKVVPVSDRYFFTQTVRRGSQGLEVLQLQTLLQSLGFFPRSTTKTNFFGPVTQTSLSSFQTANDTADEQDVRGPYTGPKTRAKLNSIE